MRLVRQLYITNRLLASLAGLIVLFVLGYFVPVLFPVARFLLTALGLLGILDLYLLFSKKYPVDGERKVADRLSNGDDNQVILEVTNLYPIGLHFRVIDEIPVQFQNRELVFEKWAGPGESLKFTYSLKPVKRGEYEFGRLLVFAASTIRLLQRRIDLPLSRVVQVYPSYLQLYKYEFLAVQDRLSEAGIKQVRKLGHAKEFDHVRYYVSGDDVRQVNWKATARNKNLMVNQHQEEKSQPIYCIIDKGRTMKMPFEQMSLLDYAINSTLVFSSIAIRKHDKPGMLSFDKNISTFIPADKRSGQMEKMLEALYKQETAFEEAAFDKLYVSVKRRITQRSLLIIFTNFESLEGMKRQLPYLRMLGKMHLLVVVFFENTELNALLNTPANDLEQVYIKTIAERFAFEKRLIARELQKYGIHSILTPPENLTVNTINKYLELKARGVI